MGARNPVGRIVSPEDVAACVTFLCSPEAEMIRGQTLVVDGAGRCSRQLRAHEPLASRGTSATASRRAHGVAERERLRVGQAVHLNP